jgi:tetratricopeptide (TPR) repeat protein
MKKYHIIFILLLFIGADYLNCPKAMTRPDSLDYMKYIPEEMLKEMTPEERKQLQDAMEMGKEMQEKGITPNISSGDALSIPPRQDKLLGEVPTLSSPQQYNDYMSGLIAQCRKNIEPAIITEVDELISKNSNDIGNLVNLGPVLLIQKKPVAAIYAAIKTAMVKPELILVQNNLAVILHQTGNPQISLPILQYLLINNNYPLILNNLAQSYLSLGDTANASTYFRACLKIDPEHSEANCGMGLLLSEEGNISEATEYIKKSLKNCYSETADGLMQKHKMNIRFSDIKQKVPEYFNPQNFKPIPPVYTIEKVEPTMELRKEFEDLSRLWNQKKDQINTEQNNKIEGESLKQIAVRNRGMFSNSPFGRKALLMLNLIGIEFAEFMAEDYKNQYLTKQIEFSKQLDELSYKKGYSEEDCGKQKEYLKDYLQKSAKNHADYQGKTLPKLYEFVNQSLYWQFFLSNEEQYKMNYINYVADFLSAIHDYDQMQSLYPLPEFISKNCNVKKELPKEKKVNDSIPEPECPIKIEMPLGVAKAKWDCKGYEIEGGELIILGFEKEYKSGEMTFFIGLGEELYGKGSFIGGVEAGWKIGSFVKVGKDFTIIDMGNKGEIGGEIGIGPFINETKITGVMGMESGIKIDKTIFGKQEEWHNSNIPEKQINPEIKIFVP